MVNLIIPPVSDCFMPTLGAAQIAGYLKENNISCKVYDANIELIYELFLEYETMDNSIKKLIGDGIYNFKNVISILNYFSSIDFGCKISTDAFDVGFSWKEIDKVIDYLKEKTYFCEMLYRIPSIIDSVNHECKYVGLSISYESQLIPALLIADTIKSRHPEICIIFGGSILYNYEKQFFKIIASVDFIDILIIGPGEKVIVQYVKFGKESVSCLKGVKMNDYNSCCIIDAREIEEQPEVYRPDFENIDFAKYPTECKAFPYIINERCYYGRCKFCNGDRVNNNKNNKSVEESFIHMEAMARETGVSKVYIVDAALSPNDLISIANMKETVVIKWIANARFEKTLCNKKLIQGIVKKGCVMLRFGLESGSQNVLNLMRKGTDINVANNILELTSQYGIKNHLYIMYGYPGEKKKTEN